MWWCVPRRLPLILAAKHGWLSQQFQAPPLERIATWDFRYPLGYDPWTPRRCSSA